MIEAAHQLRSQLPPPTCIAVHALLSDAAYRALKDVAGKVVSTNTVLHESNGIEISGLLANAAADLLSAGSGNGAIAMDQGLSKGDGQDNAGKSLEHD